MRRWKEISSRYQVMLSTWFIVGVSGFAGNHAVPHQPTGPTLRSEQPPFATSMSGNEWDHGKAAPSYSSIAPSPEQTLWVQDRLVVSFWVDPPCDDEQLCARYYADVAAAGFNTVMGGFGAKTVEAVARQLRICTALGLALIADMAGQAPASLPDGDTRHLWGYQVWDEPHPANFTEAASLARTIGQSRPGKLAYFNMDYATSHNSTLLQQFLTEVRPRVLSTDFYPRLHHELPPHDGRQGYLATLRALRDVSATHRYELPVWMYFHDFGFGQGRRPTPDPTEAEIRWQAFVALTAGAKGIFYFCYWTPAGADFTRYPALVERNGTKTAKYEEARRLNSIVHAYAPYLLVANSTHIVLVDEFTIAHQALHGLALTDLHRPSMGSGDFLVGQFQLPGGQVASLLTNWRYARPSCATATFAAPLSRVFQVEPRAGNLIPLNSTRIELDAGESMMFVIAQA